MIRQTGYLVFVLFLLIVLPGCMEQSGEDLSQVCFDQKCFDVEIAQTQEQRYKGLQHRSALEENNGMLFIFSESKQHTFWMKDTLIPLDIIWMDHDRRIVTIMTGVLPCQTEQCPSYTPKEPALYVLELNSGATIEHSLKLGDQATFKAI